MGMVLISLFAFLLLPALFIFSLIKPGKFDIRTKKNPNGKWSRGKFSAGILGAWVVAMAIGIAITPDTSTSVDVDEIAAEAGLSEDDYEVHEDGMVEVYSKVEDAEVEEQSPTDAIEASVPVNKPNKTFGITPDEFGLRMSAEAKEVGLGDISVGSFNIQEGAVNDVFTEVLSDAIAMNGTVDKNGELKGITFIMGQTDKGDTEIMNMLMMAGLSARSLSPDLPKEQTAGALTQIAAEAIKQFGETGDGKASKVVDGIKYGAMANKSIGIWVYLEAT